MTTQYHSYQHNFVMAKAEHARRSPVTDFVQNKTSRHGQFVHSPYRVLSRASIAGPEMATATPATAGTREKQKKSVNNWMAFRSHYSELFPGMQQKERSTFVMDMWAAEPFKAKWAVIAKAYSSIRNHVGKDYAPFDVYLGIVCQKIGVIEPQLYFAVMGWTLEPSVDGKPLFRRTGTSNLADYSNSTMSDKELIIYCAERGYISHFIARQINEAGPNLPGIQLRHQDLFASVPSLSAPPPSIHPAPQLFSHASNSMADFQFSYPDAYPWTGSMADLYNPASDSIDYMNFNLAPNHSWGTSTAYEDYNPENTRFEFAQSGNGGPEEMLEDPQNLFQ